MKLWCRIVDVGVVLGVGLNRFGVGMVSWFLGFGSVGFWIWGFELWVVWRIVCCGLGFDCVLRLGGVG